MNEGSSIFVVFIEIAKEFDSIPRELVWKSLKSRGVDRKLRNGIESIYKRTGNYVRIGNGNSN